MTHYVSPDSNPEFFEQFYSKNLAQHFGDVEDYFLVSANGYGVSLESKSSHQLMRRYNMLRGTNYDIETSAKIILGAAKTSFGLVSSATPVSTPKERIISACRAASHTCFLIEKIVNRALVAKKDNKELKSIQLELQHYGKAFLKREAGLLDLPEVRIACENNAFQAALDLIKEGQPLRDAVGHYTPLLKLAYERGDRVLCRKLIELEADPKAAFADMVEAYTTSLLCDAIKSDPENVALKLVAAGAKLDISDSSDGKSPLHLAACAGYLQLINEMLSRGANPSALDHKNSTPLHDACRALRADIALVLVEKGADVAQINLEALCAFRIPAQFTGRTKEVVDFYCKVLESYKLDPEELQAHGIEGFLKQCAEKPTRFLVQANGPNPFEIALLFQDEKLAKLIVALMPLTKFFDYFKKLKAKYPNSTLDLIEFCYLEVSPAHFEKKMAQLKVHPPSREVKLDEINGYVSDIAEPLQVYGKTVWRKEVAQHVHNFLARIQGRAELPGLINGDQTKKNSFYDLLERFCLKNIIITFQDSPTSKEMQEKKRVFIRELVDLEMGEKCAGKYFGVCTKLYRDISKGYVATFEDEIYILLAQHRELLLEHCVDLTKDNSRNDFNFLLAKVGEKWAVPGFETCQYYQETHGQVDLDRAEKTFNEHHTVASIIKDCIEPALEQSNELQQKFRDWVVQHIPGSWGEALLQKVRTMQAKSSPEQIREFLRKNGVSIDSSDDDFESAIEATRKQAYLEKEVYEQGKIRRLAIGRMLAGLEKPALCSDKLDFEQSPKTFAEDWFKEIEDLVLG